MKLKSNIAWLVLIVFVCNSASAQQVQPKYNNDLDRAMCVFSHDVKNQKVTIELLTGVSVLGGVGSVFLFQKSQKFTANGAQISKNLIDRFFRKGFEENAMERILSSGDYFESHMLSPYHAWNTGTTIDLLKNIPDETLQKLLAQMTWDDRLWLNISKGDYDNNYWLKSKQGQKIKTIFVSIDEWTKQQANREKIREMLANQISENVKGNYNTIGSTLSETIVREQMETALPKETMRAEIGNQYGKAAETIKNAKYVGWISLGLFILTDLYKSLAPFDSDSDLTVGDAIKFDLPMVRYYLSNPDHKTYVQNLAKRAKDCGCE